MVCKKNESKSHSCSKDSIKKKEIKHESVKHSGNLKEKERIQYFYHSPISVLPIRDVTNELGEGYKTEPHIEIGAENWLSECYQPNIVKFANSNEKYLFLITTCRNKEVNNKFGKGTNQFIVGYVEKEISDVDEGIVYVKGPTHIFSFEDSILVKDIFNYNFSRSELVSDKKRIVDYQKTKRILDHFKNKDDIREECVNKIIQLDKKNKKTKKTCQILRGYNCQFQSECLRWNR